MLRLLRFDIDYEHPHKYFLNMARYLDSRRSSVQMGWLLLNDAYSSSLVLLTRPEVLAISCLILAIVSLERIESPQTSLVGDANSDLRVVTERLLVIFELPLQDVTYTMNWIVQTSVD